MEPLREFVNKPGTVYDAEKTDTVFAEDLNAVGGALLDHDGRIEDLESLVGRVGFSAVNSNTSMSAGVFTTAVFATEIEDTHSSFDGSVFTVPTGGAGMYLIAGAYAFSSVADTKLYIVGIALNGTTITHLLGRGAAPATIIAGCGGSLRIKLNAGDTIRMLVYSGTATTGYNTTPAYCHFSAYREP